MRKSIPLLMTTFTAIAPTGAALASAAGQARSTAASHSYRGPGSSMRWGTVTVTITVRARRITAIAATYPSDRSRSRIINTGAVPTLRSEALRAQSYRIHAVSGATLTSRAFVGSLHSALHAAHLAT